jgi:hypothetical protein
MTTSSPLDMGIAKNFHWTEKTREKWFTSPEVHKG